MESLLIRGGKKLEGVIELGGAKNAVLPMLAASLLTEEHAVLENVPALEDINAMVSLLLEVGAAIDSKGSRISIKPERNIEWNISEAQCQKCRYSLLMLGVCLAKAGKVRISLPGGCDIGTRKFDMHIQGLRAMGADINVKDGYIEGQAKGLHGARIGFYYPTVTGTENIMIAASLAAGTTIIENAARNPEVVDFANFLNHMGAKIEGIGTNVLKIQGVDKLSSVNYTVMPDRILAATYMVAAAITKGDVLIKDASVKALQSEVAKLCEAGIQIEQTKEGVRTICRERVRSVNATTSAYPGFHTDVQPLFGALMATAKGGCIIEETIVDNRFGYAGRLQKMGCSIDIKEADFLCVNGKRGSYAIIDGVEQLHGAQIDAPDLRSGAALVLAALAAEGETKVTNIYQIDRGYERIEAELAKLGADIERLES